MSRNGRYSARNGDVVHMHTREIVASAWGINECATARRIARLLNADERARAAKRKAKAGKKVRP